MNSKSPTMRHAIITFLKDKERILNVALGKWFITYKGSLIRLRSYFSSETLEVVKTVGWYIQSAKRKNKNHCQPRILCLEKLFFFFWCFETISRYVVQAGLKHSTLQPLPS
jgi:hypothetical protein